MEGHAHEAFRFPLKSLPLIETFDRTSPPTRLLNLSPPLVPAGAQGPIKLQFKRDNPVTEALKAAFGLRILLEAPKDGGGRRRAVDYDQIGRTVKKLSGELSGGKGRRRWRRRSRMSNRLRPLIGKEGEKEIKSTEKKKWKWRRWRGERGCDHGRLEAASENDRAGTGRILRADGGHGRQGVGEMGEEEIG